MDKINWRQKLSSRRFWSMLGGQVTAILAAVNANERVVLQVAAIIASVGIFAVYMLSESKVDKARAEQAKQSEE